LISEPVRAYIFRGFVSCFVADTTLTPPAAGYKAFCYLEALMYFHTCSVFVDEENNSEISVSVSIINGMIGEDGTIRLPAHQALIVGKEIIRMARQVLSEGEE
jgi:hypothetical protein